MENLAASEAGTETWRFRSALLSGGKIVDQLSKKLLIPPRKEDVFRIGHRSGTMTALSSAKTIASSMFNQFRFAYQDVFRENGPGWQGAMIEVLPVFVEGRWISFRD